MTSYKKIVNALRLVAIGLLGAPENFIHGALVDASVKHKGPFPLIHVLPFTIQEDNDDTWDSANIIIGFWIPDKPSSTPEYKEDLINAMAVLSKQYTMMLKEYNGISVRGITKEPQYKHYAGTLTGYAVRFTIQVVDDCGDSWEDYLPADYNAADYVTTN